MVPLIFMIVSLYARAIWRDEVWALYYTEPSLSLSETTQRLYNNVHPPGYFYILHYWRMISNSIAWEKTLNLLFIIIGCFGARAIGAVDKKQTNVFLLLCAGSYWLIYFAAVIRPYTLMFVLASLSVLTLARILESKKSDSILVWALVWAALGMLNALSHYFALVWIGLAGLFTGLVFLRQKRFSDFVIIGICSVLALAPSCLWIWASYSDIGYRPDRAPGTWDNFTYGLNQFMRGMTAKLIGSNPAAYLIGILSLGALWQLRKPLDFVLAASALATVLVIFIGHMTWMPLIKERAFMVIIPALILLIARAILTAPQDKYKKLWRALPIICALMPFLFVGEYFKDRERLNDVRTLFLQYPACTRAPIYTFYRPFREGDGFSEYYTDMAIPRNHLVEARLENAGMAKEIISAPCPIKAIALGMPRGEKADHKKMRTAFKDMGLPLETLIETRLGKGRNVVYLAQEKR